MVIRGRTILSESGVGGRARSKTHEPLPMNHLRARSITKVFASFRVSFANLRDLCG